jgi:peroxiredoxin
MKKFALSFFLIALAAVSGLSSTPKTGDVAPAFSLADASGAAVTLKDLTKKSNVVVVFYRGSW